MRGGESTVEDQVFEAIVAYKLQHGGCSPGVREIGAAVGIDSTSVVHAALHRLEEAGRIERVTRSRVRDIHVPGSSWQPPQN